MTSVSHHFLPSSQFDIRPKKQGAKQYSNGRGSFVLLIIFNVSLIDMRGMARSLRLFKWMTNGNGVRSNR